MASARASPAASSRPRHGRPSTECSTPRNARAAEGDSSMPYSIAGGFADSERGLRHVHRERATAPGERDPSWLRRENPHDGRTSRMGARDAGYVLLRLPLEVREL